MKDSRIDIFIFSNVYRLTPNSEKYKQTDEFEKNSLKMLLESSNALTITS